MRASSTLRSMKVMRGWGRGISGRDARGDLLHQLARQRELVGLRQRALALRVDPHPRVVVAAEGGRAEVADDQRHVLAHELVARVLEQVLALGGEADAVRARIEPRDV